MECSGPPKLTSPSAVRRLLKNEGIHPRREAGQNFLVDANVLGKIERASGLTAADRVIEVGAGLGTLTRVLVDACLEVVAIESDRRLISVLEREFCPAANLRLVKADAASIDFNTLWGEEPPAKAKMVSNLPYGIAAALLIDSLFHYPWITDYTVMVQREISDRITAQTGSRDYSAATVKIRCLAEVEMLARVSRNCFYPRPRVDSAIVKLKRLEPGSGDQRSGLPPENLDSFNRIVTGAFHQRRKKLVNSLATAPDAGLDRASVRRALSAVGAVPDCRAEELRPEQFALLSRLLSAGMGKGAPGADRGGI